MISSFDTPFKTLLGILGYWALLFEASSRSAHLQGLFEVGPARLLGAMLGDLGASTLHLIKTMTQFSSLFGASNQPRCLLQCSGTTLRVRLRCPLVFLVVPACWEIFFSSCRYSTYFFFSSFLDHHTGHPARHDARIVHMSASSMPSEFFIVVSIYWKPAFYRSSLNLSSFGKTINRSAAKLICFFFFGPTCMLFDLSIAL
jgi:hypothetical protein